MLLLKPCTSGTGAVEPVPSHLAKAYNQVGILFRRSLQGSLSVDVQMQETHRLVGMCMLYEAQRTQQSRRITD
jgi:hypothetical protein